VEETDIITYWPPSTNSFKGPNTNQPVVNDRYTVEQELNGSIFPIAIDVMNFFRRAGHFPLVRVFSQPQD